MLDVLGNRTYRHLFLAQVVALVGTGLATVALGLLAFDLAGGDAGAVLGTALAIKMAAYIGVAPVVGAFADRLPRRAFLIAMDLVRAGVALVLPFVTEIWQIYALIFLLQSASAAFTPTFQATIPDVLPEEKDYTRALSLSRLAYDLESLASPAIAAALLSVISFHWLFSGTAVGFLASGLLVATTVLPRPVQGSAPSGGVFARTTRGIRIYLGTPRLRGLLAVSLAAAGASAMVIVNTVVLVRDSLGRDQGDVALALAAYGGGSMVAAFALPRVLDRVSDRSVMIGGAAAAALILAYAETLFAVMAPVDLWPWLIGSWALLGAAYSAMVTPGGRLLRRSAAPDSRSTLFAAHFALSHACWLLAYPIAGFVGAEHGLAAAFAGTGGLAVLGALTSYFLWPASDPEVVPHSHPDLPPGHPHVVQHHGSGDAGHPFVIDELHRSWPDVR